MMAVLIGAAQNILSKAAKYSLFDPCKESAFIPLDAESRTKGKAAVEVIGGPLGKSGGSFLQQVCAWILVYYRILSVLFVHCSRVCIQFLIGVFGSLSACTPYLGVALGGIIAASSRPGSRPPPSSTRSSRTSRTRTPRTRKPSPLLPIVFEQ